MATKGEIKSFMMGCRDFFGIQPGQTLMQFRDEIKALTLTDREEIAQGLRDNGYTLVQASE